jgi:predicted membrane protein
MKMGAGLFWGIVLIVIGVSIILRIAFDISVIRIVIAVIFILIGIRMLISKPTILYETKENQVIFGERNYNSDPINGSEYNTIFGKTVYDFRNIQSLPEARTKISFNTVFGSNEILLPAELPVKIKADAVFATATMPNGNTVAFGSTNYEANTEKKDTSMLVIEANSVFGSLVVKQ